MKVFRVMFIVFGLFILVGGIYGCKNEVGVEWVVDYSAVGKWSPPGRQACATGFYNHIVSQSDWEGNFNRGNADAWEEHFKRISMGGTDNEWIDSVDIAYFAGHGSGEGHHPDGTPMTTGVGRGGGFTFGVDAHDDWVLAAEPPATREPRWGDEDLEWIVLDVCSALTLTGDPGDLYNLGQRWANSDVMRGLHAIMGFATVAHDSSTRGRYFAEYLTGDRGDGTAHTMIGAWYWATVETEGAGVEGAYLGAESTGTDTLHDHLPEFGSVSKDPDHNTQILHHYSWSCL